jgi:hypothetical protein
MLKRLADATVRVAFAVADQPGTTPLVVRSSFADTNSRYEPIISGLPVTQAQSAVRVHSFGPWSCASASLTLEGLIRRHPLACVSSPRFSIVPREVCLLTSLNLPDRSSTIFTL